MDMDVLNTFLLPECNDIIILVFFLMCHTSFTFWKSKDNLVSFFSFVWFGFDLICVHSFGKCPDKRYFPIIVSFCCCCCSCHCRYSLYKISRAPPSLQPLTSPPAPLCVVINVLNDKKVLFLCVSKKEK